MRDPHFAGRACLADHFHFRSIIETTTYPLDARRGRDLAALLHMPQCLRRAAHQFGGASDRYQVPVGWGEYFHDSAAFHEPHVLLMYKTIMSPLSGVNRSSMWKS